MATRSVPLPVTRDGQDRPFANPKSNEKLSFARLVV